MNPSAFQVHKSWLIRASLVLVITALADGLAGSFLPRPILWCTLIASSLPITMLFFVALPILRNEGQKS
jgi:hypothetical protein